MLPKIDVPVYEIEMPLLKKKFRYRPFLVKEEKILLMAMESNEEKATVDAIKQIVNNCCLDEIDIETLPLVDLEYFFLNLRARSIGETVELQYKCNNTVKDENGEEKTCNNIVPLEVNLFDIRPEIADNHTNKIELSNELGIVMRYPNFKMIENVTGENEVDRLMNLILDTIELVYDKDNVYYSKDVERKELLDFVESLTKSQFEKIQEFFVTLPKIKKDLDFHCKKCNHKERITVEGIQSFFV